MKIQNVLLGLLLGVFVSAASAAAKGDETEGYSQSAPDVTGERVSRDPTSPEAAIGPQSSSDAEAEAQKRAYQLKRAKGARSTATADDQRDQRDEER